MKNVKEYVKEQIEKYIPKQEKVQTTLKVHSSKIIGTVVIVGIGFLWIGLKNNAYAVMVDSEVVGIVKQKEEAVAALESVVNNIKNTEGTDIVVKEAISVEPIKSKAESIKSQEQLVEVLASAVSYTIEAYEIVVDGKTLATVGTKEEAMTLLTEIAKENLPKNVDFNLSLEKIETPVPTNKMVTQPEITPKATPKATSKATSTATPMATEKIEMIEVAAALPQPEEKNKISVREIKINPVQAKEVAANQAKSSVKKELKAFDFNEDIQIQNAYVKEDAISSKEEAKDILLSKTEEIVEYELKEGDNIWDIAIKNETTMENILAINPQITDETRMQIGEKIKLEVPNPLVSIATTEQATFNELMPAEIKYTEDKALYKDETKVKVEGKDGLKEVTVLVDRINGKEINRTLVTEKILEEPVTKEILYGTKKKPSSLGGSSVSGGKGQFMHPLNGKGRISSTYGSRWGGFHQALDIAASAGTPVYAAAAGKVTYSGYNGGYGKLIIIDHQNGYKTYYGHNSSLYVSAGTRVEKGQNIAAVGSTGNSTGNHVHFEIRKNGSPINPYNYIY